MVYKVYILAIETMTGLERRLTIAIASEEFETQITQRLQEARGRVNIPGFRAGKVPLKEVRRRYGSAVRAEVASELMQSSFVQAVQQEQMNPAGSIGPSTTTWPTCTPSSAYSLAMA